GRRQLSAYKKGEVKTLLADLLGLDEIRALGAQALETAKRLTAGLVAVRQERAGLTAEVEQVTRALSRLGRAGARSAAAQTGRAGARVGGERGRKARRARCRTAPGRRAAGDAPGREPARARADRGHRAGSRASFVEGAGALASLWADGRSAVRRNGSTGTLQAA